jgi:phosphoglycolate phosphatase-like HAD superfamily hydrolase
MAIRWAHFSARHQGRHDAAPCANGTDEIPFDTQHQFMATLHYSHEDGAAFAYIKGAPERILSMCGERSSSGDEALLDEAFWRSRTEAVASQGQRVLALAVKAMPPGQRDLTFADVAGGFTMLALLGLIDPPREEARKAVEDCRSAGIKVKMITGDHAATAVAIARALKLDDAPKVITGQALDRLEMRNWARATSPSLPVRASHALRLVTALQADGAVIAMTGDGVNDARLKRADTAWPWLQGHEAAKVPPSCARGRQLCLHRCRRARRADGLRQPAQGHRLDLADQRRRSERDHRGDRFRPHPAHDAGSDSLGQYGDDGGSRPHACLRAGRACDHAASATRPEGAAPLRLLVLASGLCVMLFVAGAFGVFFYALDEGHPSRSPAPWW